MKEFIRFALICAFTFATDPGSAKTHEAHKAALERLQLLKQIPAEELNGFPLKKFLREVQNVQILPIPKTSLFGKDGRNCGINFSRGPLGPLILFSPKCFDFAVPEITPLIVLHELIGALGYSGDEEYEITLMLDDAMTQIERGGVKNLEPFREPLRVARAARAAGTDGGTTIVGSGGDTCELFIKRTLYRRYKDHPYYGPLAFRARVRCQYQCEQIYGRTICKKLMPTQQEIHRRTISKYWQRLRNGVVTITAPEFVGRRDFVEANPWIKGFLVKRFSEL